MICGFSGRFLPEGENLLNKKGRGSERQKSGHQRVRASKVFLGQSEGRKSKYHNIKRSQHQKIRMSKVTLPMAFGLLNLT